MYLLLSSCQVIGFKNSLEEPQDQKLVARTQRLDIIPSISSKAHVASVPLYILFFFFFFPYWPHPLFTHTFCW